MKFLVWCPLAAQVSNLQKFSLRNRIFHLFTKFFSSKISHISTNPKPHQLEEPSLTFRHLVKKDNVRSYADDLRTAISC